MKAKKVLCSLLYLAVIGSAGALMANAADYSYHDIDMNNSWTRVVSGGDLTCMYWPGSGFVSCSAQSRLVVSSYESTRSTVYVYLIGQNQSVGNRKQNSSASGDTITTPMCYANGTYAAHTYHSFERPGGASSYTYYYN